MMNIRARIIVGFLSVVLVFVVYAVFVYGMDQTIHDQVHEQNQVFRTTVQNGVSDLDLTSRAVFSVNDSYRLLPLYLSGRSDVKAGFVSSMRAFDQYTAQLSTSLQGQIKAAQTNGDTRLPDMQANLAAVNSLQQEHNQIRQDTDQIIMQADLGNAMAASNLFANRVDYSFKLLQSHLNLFQQNMERQTGGAIKGFDASVQQIDDSIVQTQRTVLIALIAGLLIALFASYMISGIISKPIQQIEGAAVAVEAGTYSEDRLLNLANRKDELGQLARVFMSMAKEVHARVERLKGQIAQLHIEIDEFKREKEVAEVVDTDFFKDLQAKAQKMRQQAHGEGTTSGGDLPAGNGS